MMLRKGQAVPVSIDLTPDFEGDQMASPQFAIGSVKKSGWVSKPLEEEASPRELGTLGTSVILSKAAG
jgi:hypothetical protein